MKFDEETRTTLQNDKMWPMLRDFSRQVQWQVNGVLTFMDEHDWKDVFTAALKKHNRVALGLDGGFVFLGMRTSKMKKSEIIDLIELMYAEGSERGVIWTERPPKHVCALSGFNGLMGDICDGCEYDRAKRAAA